ncbi:WD40 repeat-like protein [Lophiostoma macrostomum CBS 122681]|uniref:WD40 repeat-like protein n=1 Tax=Lophiostoma macrostomum CBS 122681 TaxID=1314788 RepID=A0A6A6SL73_9PLEO|nr:WD40 repeat-like protein [Lophiostoma macrostomum CBS 122681]
MPTRAQYLESYEFPLEVEHDFALDGKPAQWASLHPKDWTFQDKVPFAQRFHLELPKKMFKGERAYASLNSAMSPDNKLLAISSNSEWIVVYDIQSMELKQELEGTGNLHFRPSVKDDDTADASIARPSYTLVSSVTYDGQRGAVPTNTLILWELDKNGCLLIEEEPIDTAAYATLAIDSILPDLEAKHEWTREFVDAANLHADIEKALTRVAADHRRRHNTTIKDARIAGFDATPFSSDGKFLLYLAKNRTTQHGMREPDELPQAVVWDIDAGKEVLNLRGHTDYIAWAGFSPDQQHIATVSWDGTMRMYSTVTGDLEWTTENVGRQCWAAAFSADSKSIVWSSTGGSVVKVHAVSDGTLISTFAEEFKNWCRHLTWHPDGQQIALCADRQAWVWRPFDGPKGTVSQRFELNKDDPRFASIANIEWLKEGRSVALLINEGTTLVWDSETNGKELHRRPKGLQTGFRSEGLYYIIHGEQQHERYVSVDGDGWVRFWSVNYPEGPSWWEKEEQEEGEGKEEATEKKAYPPTGKYVNVTIKPKQEANKERDTWADKGADLWSAE